MALIKCAECGKEISDKAKSCPNCGNPIENEKLKNTFNNKPFKSLKWLDKKEIMGEMKKDGVYPTQMTISFIFLGISLFFACLMGISMFRVIWVLLTIASYFVGLLFYFNAMAEVKKYYNQHFKK